MIQITNEDNMELMARYEDNHFDLCLTDPPYNVGRKYNEYDDNMTEEEYHKWCIKWFNEANRISKTLVMTVGYKNLPFWFSLKPKHQMIWHKPNQNSPSPLGGFNAYESILIWGKNHKRIGHDIFTKNISMQKDAEWHDCPKHLKSWEIILDKFIEKPAKILDIFLGSGTTAIACHNLGFDFTGCEIDKEYFDKCVKRVDGHVAQLTMF